MEIGEERERAFALIMQSLARLPEGGRPLFAIDVDEVAAEAEFPVLRKLGIDPQTAGRRYGITPPEQFMPTYIDLWKNHPMDVVPLLSRDSAQKVLETADIYFLSCRPKETEEGLSAWADHFYNGLNIPIRLLNPSPYNGHGIRKLREKWDVLWDDSPSVAQAMHNEELTQNRALLLMNVWDDAIECRNTKNTAVLENAEEAAKASITAMEMRALKRGLSAASKQRLSA